MNYILFDDTLSERLLPFTYTRPSCEILVGIWNIREKWEHALGRSISYKVFRSYLSTKFPFKGSDDNVYVNGRLIPDESMVDAIQNLGVGQVLRKAETILAFRSSSRVERFEIEVLQILGFELFDYTSEFKILQFPNDIFSLNGSEIKKDFDKITFGRISSTLDVSNRLVGENNVFIEEGVVVTNAIINASQGPVYLAKNSEIMDGAIIRGPFSLGEHSTVKMGAKIYGDTSNGPYCKVGGEISNSVVFGYSNKGHDGFMGNSVIGEWCNWGADTNNSNLKNNYDIVKLWDYTTSRFRNSGLQFCGLMMGDHSKCGINTMFNTGTVVGVGANIFGSGFPRNFLPDFTWGGAQGFETFQFAKFLQTAEKVMQRRGIELDEDYKNILLAVYNETALYRSWEK